MFKFFALFALLFVAAIAEPEPEAKPQYLVPGVSSYGYGAYPYVYGSSPYNYGVYPHNYGRYVGYPYKSGYYGYPYSAYYY